MWDLRIILIVLVVSVFVLEKRGAVVLVFVFIHLCCRATDSEGILLRIRLHPMLAMDISFSSLADSFSVNVGPILANTSVVRLSSELLPSHAFFDA